MDYKFYVASARKFTDDEVNELCEFHAPHFKYIMEEIEAIAEHRLLKNLSATQTHLATEMCKNYIRNEYAHVRVRIDGSTFLRNVAGLTYSTSDKLAVIGGTVGLFSGFSLLVILEAIHWLVITISRIFYPEPASVQPEDPNTIEIRNLKEVLENQRQELEEMKKLLITQKTSTNSAINGEPVTVVNME